MRISLKEVFVLVFFCAGFFWCAAQVGFDNSIFWFVTIVAAVFSVVFFLCAKFRRTRWLAPLISFLFLGFLILIAMGFASLALLIDALLLLIAGIVINCISSVTARGLTYTILGCTLASFILATLAGMSSAANFESLRNKYPIVSLQNRLQYEKSRPAAEPFRFVSLSSNVQSRLNEADKVADGRRSYRSWELSMLHQHQYEKFARAQGFGVARMGQPTAGEIELDELRDIPFDNTASKLPRENGHSWSAGSQIFQWQSVEDFHRISQDDFLDSEGFGAILGGVNRVTGFIAHAFHYSPLEDTSRSDLHAWVIDRLELVSLLKFETPRAYVLDHLPRMDQLTGDDVPTRPLDDFETAALAQLWNDKDLVVSQHNNDYRMLGSLRAAKQCVECHSVQRGELLGAFSYSLHKISSQTDAQVSSK